MPLPRWSLTQPNFNSLWGGSSKIETQWDFIHWCTSGCWFSIVRVGHSHPHVTHFRFFKEVTEMSKVNKELENMAGVEPRSYKKFSSIIMTKEMITSLLYYCWLSFHSHESSLHKVFTWFWLIVCFCFFYGLCLLVFSFAVNFWRMGSHPWFLFTGFFFLDDEFKQNKIK